MASDHFKNVAMTLNTACGNAGVVLDTYGLLHLADALIAMGFDATDRTHEKSEHDLRVDAAIESHECVGSYNDGKKILAIKALRGLTGCGLKEAKDAIEDDRFAIAANLTASPWTHHHERDEPPF